MSLNDRVSGALTRIGIANDRQLETWAKVQQRVSRADDTMKQCGKTLGSLRERVAALRAEREWIPADNIAALRRSNAEIDSLRKQIGRLEQAGSGGGSGKLLKPLQAAIPLVRMLFGQVLAQQPELQARIDGLFGSVRTALQPLYDTLGGLLSRAVSWFEEHQQTVLAVVRTVVGAFQWAFSVVGEAVLGALDLFGGWIGKLREGSVPVTVLTLALGALAGMMTFLALQAKVAAAWAGIVTTAKWAWVAAQTALNIVMAASPITWIVAAVVALIGVIAYVAATTEGWGETWSNTMEWIKLSFRQAGAWLQVQWLRVQNTFLTGFELIETGWYKLQSLWNKDAADAGLARIRAARDARAAEIAEAEGKVRELAAQRRAIDIWQVRSNGKSLGDVAGGLKAQLGFGAPGAPGAANSPGASGTPSGGSLTASAAGAASMISPGGSRSWQVTINLGSLVGQMVFEGGYERNRETMQRDVESALLRVLQQAYAAQ